MKPYKHFVITRFNLKNETWSYDKNNIEVLDAAWLKKRYALFDTFCFPSMYNQKEKDFVWLVYFDTNTPERYKIKNAAYASIYPNFVPLYKKSFKDFTNDLSMDIKPFLKEITTHIITSRIDNDDAFHEDAIKVIQEQFNAQDMAVVDLNKGFCLQIAPLFRLSESLVNLGPFVSLIEKINTGVFKTIISRAHKDWDTTKDIIEIKSQHLWMQVIHQNNLLNTLNGNIMPINFKLTGFNFKKRKWIGFKLISDYFLFKFKKKLNKLKSYKFVK